MDYAQQIALRDISRELKSTGHNIFDGMNDVWVIRPSELKSKKIKAMNKKLLLQNWYKKP